METDRVGRLKNWWIRFALALALMVAAHLAYGGYLTPLPVASAPADVKLERIENFLRAAWNGKSYDDLDPLLQQNGLCWITGYRGGYAQQHEVSLWTRRATALTAQLGETRWKDMEAVEVGLATNLTNYTNEVIERDANGTWGLLLRCSQGDLCLTPDQFTRRGLFPDGQSLKYQGERHVLRLAKFQAYTWVFRRDHNGLPLRLVRGEPLVTPESINPSTVGLAREDGLAFLRRSLEQHDGLLPWSYSLSRAETSERDRNFVQLCLGSLALAKAAQASGSETDREASQRHLKAMIARYGHRSEGRCCLFDGEPPQLGAQALFAMALRAHPDPDAELAAFEEGLSATIKASLQKDGHLTTRIAWVGFRSQGDPNGVPQSDAPSQPTPALKQPEINSSATFQSSGPGTPSAPDRQILQDDAQNDQPAMALTYLALRQNQGQPLIATSQLDASLRYYLDRFQRKPQRKAIPWLALALAQKFSHRSERASADSLFMLVEWNLNQLQPFAEMDESVRGGLIAPDRLQFGKMCTTSDVGAHLSALVAARQVAEKLADGQRSQRYQNASQEMSRYLRQLQVRSRGELYWMPPRQRTYPLGGFRETTWASEIQVDSTAYAILAWCEMLSESKGKP